ncbi:uncharacterized protein [Epargyreus clarus]|uniref:uncharacterized protein n=1 Tax=Epargyreus clarus TaxID=520877 RepID=UPI003C2E11D1
MEDEEVFVGCICCMSTNDLLNLFAVHADNEETFAQVFQTCFDVKVTNEFNFICMQCAEQLEAAAALKKKTIQSIAMLQSIRDEEYLDESILAEAEGIPEGLEQQRDSVIENVDEDLYPLDETTCVYCNIQLSSAEQAERHMNRCHSDPTDAADRQFACHFCDNVYVSRKACFTHLRMKHGLKLCNENAPQRVRRERSACHVCGRDFSQKQILNNHLWKAHGLEVQKRKAFVCPLCAERVSYGAQLSAHLRRRHAVRERVHRLAFRCMDDFMVFKSAVQEETKYRFRKTTASKQTIEGVRSHYMCSQSGMYVYQGKGKRAAPERQIYKTGRACPAHMIVTETADRVLLTFYTTHVGHGTCPYYEPREPKRIKSANIDDDANADTPAYADADNAIADIAIADIVNAGNDTPALVCDACGAGLADAEQFRAHVAAHGLPLYPCEHCSDLFQNMDAWERHTRLEHDVETV